jgi:diguanylate cyclase (GGDEF)-like protein
VTYLAVQGVVVAVSLLLPDPAGGLVRLAVAGVGIGVLVWAVAVRRPRRRAGWWLVALSGVLFYAEALTIAILSGLGPGERVASVRQLGLGIWGLLALAVGLAALGWRTVGRRGWDALDTAMTAIGAFLLVWAFYIDPTLTSRPSGFATAVAIGLPSVSLLVFAMAVKLALGGALATWSGRLLLLSTAAALYTSASFFVPIGASTIVIGPPIIAAGLAQTILLGATGVAVDFNEAIVNPTRSATDLPRWRVVLFLLLALLAPFAAALDFARAGASGPHIAAVMVPPICATLILGLLVIRLALVAQVATRRAEQLDQRSASLARAMAEQDELQRQLRHRAQHDPLTGLANRDVLIDRMELLRDTYGERQDLASRGQALMMLDLDGFKDINDSFGHPVGDQLLAGVGQRLLDSAPDEAVVARLGGDEFAILLSDTPEDAARRAAEALLEALRSPFVVADLEVVLSASIGLLITEPDARPPGSSEGLRDVDQALYAAKAAGRNRVAEFSPTLLAQRLRAARTSTALHSAVVKDELLLHYQPIIGLDDGRIAGLESLVRWWPIGGEMVPPAEFIPVAEQTGLINEIGNWVLRRACRDARPWNERYGVPIGVNVSARQFSDSGFADLVLDILAETGLPGSALVLELTETSVIESSADLAVRTQLNRLRDWQIRIAIDDFGTGYSSLSNLAELPVDAIKIDSSFVPNSVEPTETDESSVFIRAILQLATGLKLAAVAEGVETAEQAAALRKLKCPYAQGYYFCRPVPADRIDRILEDPTGLRRRPGRLDPALGDGQGLRQGRD